MLSTITPTPDIADLKARLKTTWTAGNWDYFSRFMESSSAEFLNRLAIPAGARLLDVACGSGGLCMIAARQGVNVTGVDLAPNAIAAARGRARLEGLAIRYEEGDAEELPFPDAGFDAVTSIFGAMFAPRPELVARELLRVCRPGGTVAMGNWTPQGFIGQMFKMVAGFLPPPGVPSPVLWGTEEAVRERLGPGLADLSMTPVTYRFEYPFPPEEVVEFFRVNYGPTNRAWAALPPAKWEALRAELVDLWSAHNVAPEGNTAVDAVYLHVAGTRA